MHQVKARIIPTSARNIAGSGRMYRSYLIIFFGLWMVLTLKGQDEKTKLQDQRSRIEEEIRYTNKLLEETRKNRVASVNEVVLINNKIGKRQQLISAYNNELRLIERNIQLASQDISALQKELEALKAEYARMIFYAQKNRNAYRRLMFVFSAESFNQAYRRLKYFQQYSEYRRRQADLIREKELALGQRILGLEERKAEQLVLLKGERTEQQKLQQEKGQKNITVSNLKQQEKKLLQTLREKEQARARLNKEIERIIAEEIRKAREAGGDRSKAKPGDYFELTPEELALSNDFAGNQGKLPWPLERGVIAGSFGEQDHPVLKGIKTKSNGVDIVTAPGAQARSVFKGKVSRVMNVPRFNTVIIIRHGEFLTVYSNLDEVLVKAGDQVDTKQVLGRIHTQIAEGKTELHFEIWKGKTVMDPALWLAR